MSASLFAIASLVMAYSMIAKRLSTTIITAPMVFLLAGFIMAKVNILPQAGAETVLHFVAEIALIILLFLDASQTNLAALRARRTWPFRMLLFGLPLSILLGTLVGVLLLPDWPLVAVLLLAAVLAPTDAALGQPVISNPIVPQRTRRALVVESGLNDGLALPLILLFASLTANMMGQQDQDWLTFGAKQIVLGPIVGAVVGYVAGKVLIWAKDRETTSEPYEGVGAIALALAAYVGADAVGGNGFIAAFTAGLLFGDVVKGRCKFIYEFTESEGQGLSWAAFFMIGLVLVPEALPHLDGKTIVLIVLSLFVVRPVAIWISLIATDANFMTRIFFGWFGPRGLATALFALVVVDEIGGEMGETILHIAVNTVWISALLHGVTAAPASRLYARLMAQRSA